MANCWFLCPFLGLALLAASAVVLGTPVAEPAHQHNCRTTGDGTSEPHCTHTSSTGDSPRETGHPRSRRGLAPQKTCVLDEKKGETVCGSPIVQVQPNFGEDDSRNRAESVAPSSYQRYGPATSSFSPRVVQTTIFLRNSGDAEETNPGTAQPAESAQPLKMGQTPTTARAAPQNSADPSRVLSTDPVALANQLLSILSGSRRPASIPMTINCDLDTLSPLPGVNLPDLLASNPQALANLTNALQLSVPAALSPENFPGLTIQPLKPANYPTVTPMPPPSFRSADTETDPMGPLSHEELSSILAKLQVAARQNSTIKVYLQNWAGKTEENEEIANELSGLEEKLAKVRAEARAKLLELLEETARDQKMIESQLETIRQSQQKWTVLESSGSDGTSYPPQTNPAIVPANGATVMSTDLGTASLDDPSSAPKEGSYRYGGYGMGYGMGHRGYMEQGYMHRPHIEMTMGVRGMRPMVGPYGPGAGMFRESETPAEAA